MRRSQTTDPSASEQALARARTAAGGLERGTKADDATKTDLAEEDFLGKAEPEEEPQANLEGRRRCRQAYWVRSSEN